MEEERIEEAIKELEGKVLSSKKEREVLDSGIEDTKEVKEGEIEKKEETMDLEDLYSQSKDNHNRGMQVSDTREIFNLLESNKRISTPSSEFELIFKDYYTSPRLKGRLQVRMLTVAEDKLITSIEEPQERLIKAIQLSITDLENRELSKSELEQLYIAEIEHLYLRYRIHNLSRYHKISYQCPKCSSIQEEKLDLTTLEINKPQSAEGTIREVYLPLSNFRAKIGIPTLKDQRRLNRHIEHLEERRKKSFTVLEKMVETNIAEKALAIREFGGVTIENELETAKMILERLPANDLLVLERHFREFSNLGVNYTLERKCPVCGHVFETIVPFSWELFRPAL